MSLGAGTALIQLNAADCQENGAGITECADVAEAIDQARGQA